MRALKLSACQRRDSWVRPKTRKLQPGEQWVRAADMDASSAEDMWGEPDAFEAVTA